MRRLTRVLAGAALVPFVAVGCSQGLVDGSGRAPVDYRRASPGPFVETDGVATRYEKWGTTGTPIVLVHGFIESTYVWRPVAERLAREHVVYALDLRGFGYTERRGPYTLDGWTRQLAGFLDALGIKRPVLVGHSLGAAPVAELARREPGRVAGIVLADGDARKGGAGPPPAVRQLIRGPVVSALLRIGTRTDLAARFILPRAWGPTAPHFSHADYRQWLAPLEVAGTEGALLDMAHREIAGLDDDALATVRVPALVIWGGHDELPLADGRTAARLVRAPLIVLPGSGHLAPLADPDGFTAAVARFSAAHR